MDKFFVGMAVNGHLSSTSQGRTTLHGEFVYRALVEPIASFHGNANDVGVVETPVTTSWHTRVDLPLEASRWALVGVSPVQGDSRSLVVLVRAVNP